MVKRENNKAITLMMALVLIITSTLSVFAEDLSEVHFSDLKSKKWYTETVIELAEKGVLKGHNDLVRPNDEITRAEYAQILHNISKEKGLLPLEGTDIKDGAWYYDAMQAAITFGILRGDGYGKYRPNDPVTRQEVFVMTTRAFQIDTKENTNKLLVKFKDHRDVSSWAKEATAALVEVGYLRGDNLLKLSPKKNITRAELASLIKDINEVKELPKIINVNIKKDPEKPLDKPKEDDKNKPIDDSNKKPTEDNKDEDYTVPDWVNEPAKVWVEEEGHWEDVYEERLVENALIIVHPAKYEIETKTEYIFHERSNPGYGATFYTAQEALDHQRMITDLRDSNIKGNFQIREVKKVTDKLIEPEREEVVKPAKYEKVKVGRKWVVDKPGYWKYLD